MTTKYRDMRKMTYSDFCMECRDNEKKETIRNDIINGDVYIIKNAISKEIAQKLLNNITSSEFNGVSSIKIVESVKNFYYESNYVKKKSGEYSAIDRSWYFFPWNKDQFGLNELVQPIFNSVILLNKKEPEVVIKNTPKDKFVQRYHLINYPLGSGKISLHTDPVNVVQISGGIYFTEYGIDYDAGGFYVLNQNDEVVMLDKVVGIGDLVLFYPGLPHGVSPVTNSNTNAISSGRYFLSMTIVESHEKLDRITSVGLD